ncbi:Gluconolactonase [Nocardia africana]|uniref:Gluconolactonase n=1 Tax=Nocardia africana TaxID=134964 RepID=A0A378X420_9NOCA|nr:Gluconolactonase [Nocardia africana]
MGGSFPRGGRRRIARCGRGGANGPAGVASVGVLATVWIGAAAVLPYALAPVHAEAPGCPASSVEQLLPATAPLLDFAENLGYDAQGNLWVSRVFRNVVQRYDSGGRVTAEVPVDAPGAIRLGPDGALYVVFGDSSAGLLPGAHSSGVVRFDPGADRPVPQVYVSGLGMANGATFDGAGTLYVADTAHGVVKVRPGGSVDADWTARAAASGVNGIVLQGDSLYATLYQSLDGRVVRIPVDAPQAQTTVASVTVGALPLTALPDDLTVGPDGMLYVATTTGRVVRVDPNTGGVCTVADLGVPATSVSKVPADDRALLVTTGVGSVLRVVLGA